MQISIILTEQQAQSVIGKEFTKGCFFNPIKDAYDRWTLSLEEIISVEDIAFLWLWDCPFILFTKPYQEQDIIC